MIWRHHGGNGLPWAIQVVLMPGWVLKLGCLALFEMVVLYCGYSGWLQSPLMLLILHRGVRVLPVPVQCLALRHHLPLRALRALQMVYHPDK